MTSAPHNVLQRGFSQRSLAALALIWQPGAYARESAPPSRSGGVRLTASDLADTITHTDGPEKSGLSLGPTL